MGERYQTIVVRQEVDDNGSAWSVRVVITAPPGSDRDVEPIRSEIVKRLPSWIKAKIEKG